MTEPTTIVVSALWRILAKVPWLTRLLLPQAFPVSRCRALLVVDAPGSHVRFELLRVRPSAALLGVEATLHNHLPFHVEIEVYRLSVAIDSVGLLDAVQNTKCTAPAAGSVSVQFPEVTLSNHQADWVRARQGGSVRIHLSLSWRCRSSFRTWEDQKGFGSLAYVNKDPTGAE